MSGKPGDVPAGAGTTNRGCRLQARTIPSQNPDASVSFDKINRPANDFRPGLGPRRQATAKCLAGLGFSAVPAAKPLRAPGRSCIRCASRGLLARRLMGPHRLEAQDGALSRRKPGFESPWGRQLQAYMSVLAIRFRVLRAP